MVFLPFFSAQPLASPAPVATGLLGLEATSNSVIGPPTYSNDMNTPIPGTSRLRSEKPESPAIKVSCEHVAEDSSV